MAFDGLVINGVVKELENTILNNRIEKIYQPNQAKRALNNFFIKDNLISLEGLISNV